MCGGERQGHGAAESGLRSELLEQKSVNIYDVSDRFSRYQVDCAGPSCVDVVLKFHG
jgi:hypothetical protein